MTTFAKIKIERKMATFIEVGALNYNGEQVYINVEQIVSWDGIGTATMSNGKTFEGVSKEILKKAGVKIIPQYC